MLTGIVVALNSGPTIIFLFSLLMHQLPLLRIQKMFKTLDKVIIILAECFSFILYCY